MADHGALIDKPVLAVAAGQEPVRGIFRAEVDHPWVRTFDGLGGVWRGWESLTVLPFGELTRDELLAWHEDDPLGYLKAGYAWARDNQET